MASNPIGPTSENNPLSYLSNSLMNEKTIMAIIFRLNLGHTGGNGCSVNPIGTLSTLNATPVPIAATGLLLHFAGAGVLLGIDRRRVLKPVSI